MKDTLTLGKKIYPNRCQILLIVKGGSKIITDWDPGLPREAFSDEKSQEIRGICVAILSRMDQIMHHELSPEKNGQFTAELEGLGGRLIELGVYPRIHCGRPKEDFQNPVVMTEWVAGSFLYQYTGYTPPTSSEARMISSEYATGTIANSQFTAYLVPSETLHRKIIDFSIAEWAGINTMHYLSVDPSELELSIV